MVEKEYIDREALLDEISDIKMNGSTYRVIFYDDVVLAPAADVAPVIHGHWEEKVIYGEMPDYDCVCSVCGSSGIPSYRYCPNCGARVDEEANK